MLALAAVLLPFVPYAAPPVVVDFQFYRYVTAGWEDFVFVYPAIILPRPWHWLFIALSSVVFASLHGYQGDLSMYAKLPFVAVSYYYAERYGIMTTAVAHSLNDVLVWCAVTLLSHS